MRALLFVFLALASAGSAKGKTGKASSPTASPTVTQAVQSSTQAVQSTQTVQSPTQGAQSAQGNQLYQGAQSTQSTQRAQSNQSTTQGAQSTTQGAQSTTQGAQSTTQGAQSTQGAPTPATVLLDLKTVALRMFQLWEANRLNETSALFAPGMSYITNGHAYDLDLSIPAHIRSVPQRKRTQVVWSYVDSDEYEIWGHCLVTLAGANSSDPEFILLHFNKLGLIDVFSHIQPKAAQCTAMVKDVVKLALMRPDGTIVDAPQDQLQRMMAAQNATSNSTMRNQTGMMNQTAMMMNQTVASRANQTTVTVTNRTTTTQTTNATRS